MWNLAARLASFRVGWIGGLAALVVASVSQPSHGSLLEVPTELYPTIQAAVDSAAVGDTVLVAAGIYRGPGNRNIVIDDDMVVRSTMGSSATVLQLDGSRDDPARGFLLTDLLTSASLLEGFTLRDGFMSSQESRLTGRGSAGVGAARHDLSAGGFKVNSFSAPIVRDMVVESCESEFTGGGVSIEIGSAPTLIDVHVSGCVAGIQGGGISVETGSNPIIENCSFTGNRAPKGGGVFVEDMPIFRNVTIAANYAEEGGGIYCLAFSDARFERVLVWGNCADVAASVWTDFSSSVTFVCSGVNEKGIAGDGTAELDADTRSLDPMFCDVPAPCGLPTTDGDFRVDVRSPYLAEQSACGLDVGAFEIGCDGPEPTFETTWGRVKAVLGGQARPAGDSR